MKKVFSLLLALLFILSAKAQAETKPAQSSMADSLVNAIRQNSKLSSENKKLSDENSVLEQEKVGLLDNLKAATRERDNLKKNLKIISDKVIVNLTQAKQDINRIKDENKRLLLELNKISKKNNSLAAEVAKYRDLAKAREEQINKPYKQQISMLKQELERVNNQSSLLQSQLLELEQKKTGLTQQLRQTSTEKNKYQDELSNLGYAKEFSKAASADTQKRQINRETAKAHYDLGALYFKSGKYKEAAKEYEMLLSFAPDDPAVAYNLAVIYGDYLKDSKKEIEYFKRYLTLAPRALNAAKIRERIRIAESKRG